MEGEVSDVGGRNRLWGSVGKERGWGSGGVSKRGARRRGEGVCLPVTSEERLWGYETRMGDQRVFSRLWMERSSEL